MRARDLAGNTSAESTALPVTPIGPDNIAPSVPANLHTTAVTHTQVDLAWNASTDTDSGVAGEAPALYDISSISNSDLAHVIPIAIIVIGVLLAVLLSLTGHPFDASPARERHP